MLIGPAEVSSRTMVSVMFGSEKLPARSSVVLPWAAREVLLIGVTTKGPAAVLQTPDTGVHTPRPTPKIAAGGLLTGALRMYHLREVGSMPPGFVEPFPFQSRVTGFQPGLPKGNWPASGAPALCPFRRYQILVGGLITP